MSTSWLERAVIVTVGTGGVGKTTTAAAIALEAAARGQRTLVLTIDPARRLANALGLDALGHEPQAIDPAIVREVRTLRGLATGDGAGELHAMMLDTKRTFDELVERIAPDADARRRILENPIYRNLTDALSGSREYSAMEKLHQVHASRAYDLIVLDTPPASHALQFLDAPTRLVGFLDGSFLPLLLKPAAALGRTSFRLFRSGSTLALRALERITGLGFFTSLSEFLLAFEGLFGGFHERAEQVSRLLRSGACGFVLVAGPDPEQVRRTVDFWNRLRADRIPLVGLIVNRVQTWPGGHLPPEALAPEWDEARDWLAAHLDPASAACIEETVRRHAVRARRDADMSAQLEKGLPLRPDQMHRIPLVADDIHSAPGLARMGAHLFDETDR